MNWTEIAAPLLALAGMAFLALGMERHFPEVLGRPGLRRGWRAAGCLLLAAALMQCVAARGFAIGLVLWSGLLSAGVLAVAGYLAARPRR